jgi:hypothetical protein
MNSNKIVFSGLLLFFLQSASGAEGIIFDNSGIIAVETNGAITGYYDAEDEKKSCSFLFVQIGTETEPPAVSPYSETKLLTFNPTENDFTFSGRNRSFDIAAVVYKMDDAWIIRTDVAQAGCENALGSFVSYPSDKVGGQIFSEQKRVPAVGIRLIGRKSFLYDLRGGEFKARKGYLTKWNGVLVLQVRDRFSYVRFADPRVYVANSGRVTTGWVRSADLVDPFPPATKPSGKPVQ